MDSMVMCSERYDSLVLDCGEEVMSTIGSYCALLLSYV